MIETILTGLIFGLGAFVFLACICRLRVIRLQTHQSLWVKAYACVAFWAFAEGIEALIFEADPITLAGLAGAALWLWGSRVSWRDGPPPYLERKPQ
jgi:hypothetical protein